MKAKCIAVLLSFALLLSLPAARVLGDGSKGKSAVVVASFGSTVPESLPAILNIVEAVRAAYPHTEVRLTFTSNIIRSIWKKRQAEAAQWLDRGVPEEVLYVENIITTLGDLLEDGFTNIVVQPTHMFFMEQSYDLRQYVNGLANIETMKRRWRPFDNLVMGRPALGEPGDRYPYLDDIEAAAVTLADDAELARASGAALVYVGHGNENWSTGIYHEMQAKMRERYPGVLTLVGVVEGNPGIEDVLAELRETGIKRVVLKPFMIVAGTHALEDMAGDGPDSWKSALEREGYEVRPVMEGLGSNDAFARLFVDHIKDAAGERNIPLN